MRAKLPLRWLSILSVLVFGLALSLPALAGETGSISGKVTDAKGDPLPGVLVKVVGAQLPAGRTTASSANGAYQFQRLIPGPYTVSAELSGLGKASSSLDVLVDNDHQINLSLKGATETQVEVSAASVDVKTTEVNFNYTQEQIKNLPLERSYTGLINLVPGVADPSTVGLDDGAGTGFSAAGGTRQDNKFLIDGVNITNPGYGVLLVETNEMDIADFNVKKGAISAEFGRTSGAILNAVTRSGTNDFHGGFRFEAQPDAFISEKKNTTVTQTIDRYTTSANLGFPIVKDMLFGYASGRYFTSTKSGQSSQYGTQPDTKGKNGDIFAKLTATPAQSIQLNAGFRALPTKSENQFDSVLDVTTAGYDTDVTNYVTSVTGSFFPTSTSLVEAKFVHLTEHDTADAATFLPDQPHTIDPRNLGAYGRFLDNVNRGGGNVGVAEFKTRGDDYKRDEVRLSASQFFDLGPTQHQIKLGGGFENTEYSLVRETNGWGLFATGANCVAAVCGTLKTGTIRARFYTLQPEQTGKGRTYSIFLQDTVTYGRFSANVGLLVNKDDFAQITLAGDRINFLTFNWGDEIQPRIGIVYNTELLKGDKAYANWGRYYGQDQKSASRSHAPFRIRQDEAYFDPVTGAFLAQNIRGSSGGHLIPAGQVDPQYIDELIVGYGAPVTRTLTAEVYYQYRETHDIWEDMPIDPNNFGGSFKIGNLPGARRRYRAITLDVAKRISDRWAAEMNYTYSKLYGNFDLDYSGIDVFNNSSILEDAPGINTSEPNRYGRLSEDRPHIFKLNASYDTPFGVTVGGFLRVQSGGAWEARGIDANLSSYRYLEPAGSRRLPSLTTFDLLAAYNFKIGGGFNFRLEGRALNLFDQQVGIRVNKLQYNDPYVAGVPAATLGPQGTTRPNASFGNYTVYSQPRRIVLTGIVEF